MKYRSIINIDTPRNHVYQKAIDSRTHYQNKQSVVDSLPLNYPRWYEGMQIVVHETGKEYRWWSTDALPEKYSSSEKLLDDDFYYGNYPDPPTAEVSYNGKYFNFFEIPGGNGTGSSYSTIWIDADNDGETLPEVEVPSNTLAVYNNGWFWEYQEGNGWVVLGQLVIESTFGDDFIFYNSANNAVTPPNFIPTGNTVVMYNNGVTWEWTEGTGWVLKGQLEISSEKTDFVWVNQNANKNTVPNFTPTVTTLAVYKNGYFFEWQPEHGWQQLGKINANGGGTTNDYYWYDYTNDGVTQPVDTPTTDYALAFYTNGWVWEWNLATGWTALGQLPSGSLPYEYDVIWLSTDNDGITEPAFTPTVPTLAIYDNGHFWEWDSVNGWVYLGQITGGTFTPDTFIGLPDTPSTYTAGALPATNGAADALIWSNIYYKKEFVSNNNRDLIQIYPSGNIADVLILYRTTGQPGYSFYSGFNDLVLIGPGMWGRGGEGMYLAGNRGSGGNVNPVVIASLQVAQTNALDTDGNWMFDNSLGSVSYVGSGIANVYVNKFGIQFFQAAASGAVVNVSMIYSDWKIVARTVGNTVTHNLVLGVKAIYKNTNTIITSDTSIYIVRGNYHIVDEHQNYIDRESVIVNEIDKQAGMSEFGFYAHKSNGGIVKQPLPTYVDNAAALAGGLTVDMHYQTPAGKQMIVRNSVTPDTFTFTDLWSNLIELPQNKTYRIIRNVPFAGVINEIVAITASGTATVNVTINGVNLGGGANSASSTESVVTHTTANTFQVGDDIAIVLTSATTALDLTVSINYTR
jgi:hypothetical protein